MRNRKARNASVSSIVTRGSNLTNEDIRDGIKRAQNIRKALKEMESSTDIATIVKKSVMKYYRAGNLKKANELIDKYVAITVD